MYERRGQHLLSRAQFVTRLIAHFVLGFGVIVVALTIGVLGYHFLAHLNLVDSILNASMILGGMGPVDHVEGTAAKLFASGYALFSGLVFIGVAGLLLTPVLHRLMHHFHIAEEDESGASKIQNPKSKMEIRES